MVDIRRISVVNSVCFMLVWFCFNSVNVHAQLQRLTLEEAGLNIGGQLPSTLMVYDTTGKLWPVNGLLKGHYTVIVTGCLTCPVFFRTYPKVEAIAHDYSSKRVQFYYLYKLLAHPENHGIVKVFTIEERFMQVDEAKSRLQTRIPWLTDPLSNEVSKAFAVASNAEVMFNPEGKIVYMSQWSNDVKLRAAMEKVFGAVTPVTDPEELHFPAVIGRDSPIEGIVPRVEVNSQLITLKVIPQISDGTFYAKLRAEVDDSLFYKGSGHMYLGFHLDPLHHVHWNNLADPIRFSIEAPEGTIVNPSSDVGPKVDRPTDIDPREFFIEVKNWPKDKLLPLTVDYFACDANDKWCVPVTQHYLIQLEVDQFGGRVYDRSFR